MCVSLVIIINSAERQDTRSAVIRHITIKLLQMGTTSYVVIHRITI